MLEETEFKSACKLLVENDIDYVEIITQNPPDPNIPHISNLYNDAFVKVYENTSKNYSIYKVKPSCIRI